MTTRVAALSGSLGEDGVVLGPAARVHTTPALVDRAVEETLRFEPPHIALQLRDMWSRESDIEVAQLLRAGASALADRARFPSHVRISANIPYPLTDDQSKLMIEWFKEFKLTFNAQAGHDHGMAAAIRHMDNLSMLTEIPPGMRYVDFGGNLLFHVRNGMMDAVTVRMPLDDKDSARFARTNLELEVLAKKHATASVGTQSWNTAEMVRSIRAGETKYLVEGRLETFSGNFLVGVMSHVYDVPIAAIPLMMERTGMKMFLITLHFSNRFFDTDEGELPDTGARYRIDRKADRFEMGLVGSGAKWYTHKWSEFQRYGADQILCGKKRRYSLKIVKRRGDTLSYRVLEIAGTAMQNFQQYYKVPDVPCVRVTADLGRKTHDHGRKLDEIFPQDVWNRMVRNAAVDISRGVMDYHKFVGNYDQMVAGHTYNGVDAVLGTVPREKVAVLVALSTVSAMSILARMRAGIRYGIDHELDFRSLNGEGLTSLSIKFFVEAVIAAVSVPFVPLFAGLRQVSSYMGDKLLQSLIEVEPVRQIKRIPVDVYQMVLSGGLDLLREDFPSREFRLAHGDLEQRLLEMTYVAREEALPALGSPTVEGEAVSQVETSSSTAVEEVPVETQGKKVGLPDWMPVGKNAASVPPESWHGVYERRECIREEIEIIQQEAANLEAWMHLRWLDVMATGTPNAIKLRDKRDEWKEMDAWFVRDNVISESALRRDRNLFTYSGVYCPDIMQVDDGTGKLVQTKLREVDEATWSSSDGTKQAIHAIMAGPQYTGWVLVNANMQVLNGPQVAAGLTRALGTPLDYELGAYVGGPGCGKTHQITQRVAKRQLVTSPLRLSVEDMRESIRAKHGCSMSEVQMQVRTIDSWLCYAGKGRALPFCAEVLSDEAWNGRASRAYAVWGLMRARRVVAYGDKRQIPPVDSSGSIRLYPEIMPKYCVEIYEIHRFGPEVLALIAGHYDYKLRSVHPVGYSEVRWVEDVRKFTPKTKSCYYMTMNQAQKPIIRRYFGQLQGQMSTTHEAQGKSVEEAFIAQFDGRVRPVNDPFDLYSNPRYVNVGLTRAKKVLNVGSMAPRSNLLKEWFERGQDARRVAACADISTAGQSFEFFGALPQV